jgi:hypothetical protein
MIGTLNPTDLGIRVLLWVGKILPLPAPPWFSQSLQRVEVTRDVGGCNGFQLTFALSRDSLFDYTGLTSGTLDSFNRVVIGVLMGPLPEILIDGVITHQQLTPSDQPGKTTVCVTGMDVTKLMDLEQQSQPFDNHPDSLIVERLLRGYSQYGVVPLVAATPDVPISVESTPWQCVETDLCCIKRLAKQNGYVFFVEPLSLGTSTAYFGPDLRLGPPQSALTTNMGAASNVITIQHSEDPLKAVGAKGNLLIPLLGITLPLPPLPLPVIPPLARRPTVPRRSVYLSSAASANLPQAVGMAQSAMETGRDTVTCKGTLDAVRYGGVLKTRRQVGVRGAGSYDGQYWVKRVTHTIENGKYTQAFSLGREGQGALLPVVVP